MTAPAPSQLGAAGREGPRGAGRYGSLPTHVGGAGATQQQQPPPQQQQQPQPPSQQQRRRRLRAWYGNQLFVNLVELGSEGARGLVLPSLYMYQARLGGSTQFMCLLVAAFSLGRVISSTALGVMCDRHGMRRTYVVALLISAAGNALYALADVGCLDSRYALLAARFVVGFGAGNRAVCRADVAALTTASQRLRWITILSATIFAGYGLTPGLGSAIATVHGDFMGFTWNEYNTPGALLALYNLALVGLAHGLYDVRVTVADGPPDEAGAGAGAGATAAAGAATAAVVRGGHGGRGGGGSFMSRNVSVTNVELMARMAAAAKEEQAQEQAQERERAKAKAAAAVAAAGGSAGLLPQQTILVGIWLCVLLNFVSRGILAVLEIATTPLYLYAVDLPPASPAAVSRASLFQLGMGVAGMCTFVAIDRLRRRVAELHLLAFAFACTALGCALLVPDLAGIGLPRFVSADLLAWSIGSPISGAVVIASFSKIIGPQKQGKQMGYIGSAGSAARVIMPLVLGALPGSQPFETEFAMLAALAALCCAASMWYFELVKKQHEGHHSVQAQLSESSALRGALL